MGEKLTRIQFDLLRVTAESEGYMTQCELEKSTGYSLVTNQQRLIYQCIYHVLN